jgi:hypothetical protein
MTSKWPLQRDCPAFYGNPDPNGDGVPDRAWEDEHLTAIKPPWTMCLAWDLTKAVRTIRVHKRCAESLARVLGVISARFLTQEGIERNRLHAGLQSFVDARLRLRHRSRSRDEPARPGVARWCRYDSA